MSRPTEFGFQTKSQKANPIVTLTLLSVCVNRAFLSGSLRRDGGFVFFLIHPRAALSCASGARKIGTPSARFRQAGSVELWREPAQG
jgi:hypothetical protein